MNPEFRRNLWLELSTHRLIMAPLTLAAIFYLCRLVGSSETIANFAYYIFLFFVFVWGTRKASDAVVEEVNNKTWDYQRLSVLSPSTLTFGKLFGSTSFAWYGGGICLAVYLLYTKDTQASHFGAKLYIILAGALITHAFALLCSLVAMQRYRSGKLSSFKYFLLSFIVGAVYTNGIAKLLTLPMGDFTWHGYQFEPSTFYVISITLFLIWALIGNLRLMKKELQFQTLPMMWGLFTLYCMIYFSGFFDMGQHVPFLDNELIENIKEIDVNADFSHLPKYIALWVAIVLGYLSMLTANISKVTYQKLITNIKEKNWLRAWHYLPSWSLAGGLIYLTALLIMFTPGTSLTIEQNHWEFKPFIFAAALMLLVGRDILLIHYFHFAKNTKRAALTSLFYLAILYILVPSILSALHFDVVLACFLPQTGSHPIASITGPLVQCVFVFGALKRRWEANSIK